MTNQAKRRTGALLAVLLVVAPATAFGQANCRNTGAFEPWLATFKKEAAAQGISPAAASFLKAASHGSNAPVLRQFAWPNAAAGAPTTRTANRAPIPCFACIVMYRPRRVYGQAARLIAPCLGDSASCSWNGNSPILVEGVALRRPCDTMSDRRAAHRRPIFDNIMTLRL